MWSSLGTVRAQAKCSQGSEFERRRLMEGEEVLFCSAKKQGDTDG